MGRIFGKHILSAVWVVFALLLALSLLPERADAAGDYSVQSADFAVQLNEDGSADVTETWAVKYTSGSFTRFYKEIYTALPPAERFESLENVSVTIDGRACELTHDTSGRPDYHYSIQSGNYITLSAYLHTGAATHTYVYSYHLTDVVKSVEGEYNLFCYRYIGANFSTQVNNITVTVTPPSGCDMSVLYKTKGSAKVTDEGAIITCKRNTGMFKVRLRMDGDIFTGLRTITAEQSRDDGSSGNTLDDLITLILEIVLLAPIPLGFLFLIFLAVISIIKEVKIGKLIATNTYTVTSLIDHYRLILTPLELGAITTKKSGRIISALLAEEVHNGRIIYNKDEEELYFPQVAENSLIDLLMKCWNEQPEDERVTDSFGRMTLRVDAVNAWVTRNASKIFEASDKAWKLLKKSASARLKEHDKEAKNRAVMCGALAKMIESMPSVSLEEIMREFTHENIVRYLTRVQFAAPYDSDRDGSLVAFDYYSRTGYDHEYKSRHSSAGGGSGCSSCSSCSSCGGGGAD